MVSPTSICWTSSTVWIFMSFWAPFISCACAELGSQANATTARLVRRMVLQTVFAVFILFPLIWFFIVVLIGAYGCVCPKSVLAHPHTLRRRGRLRYGVKPHRRLWRNTVRRKRLPVKFGGE